MRRTSGVDANLQPFAKGKASSLSLFLAARLAIVSRIKGRTPLVSRTNHGLVLPPRNLFSLAV